MIKKGWKNEKTEECKYLHGGGGGPAEPVLQKECVLTDNVNVNCHAELDSASGRHGVLPLTLDRFRNKFGMTPPEAVLCLADRLSVKKYAFTMAEILLSLTIIGVVAAITLPSLTGNINERTWNTQRKALYARFSQAIALMPALNGYGTYVEESSSGAGDAEDTLAETFITSGLSQVLKINNICDADHIEDCGIVSAITTLDGNKVDTPTNWLELNSQMTSYAFGSQTVNIPNAKAAAFETQNGESILTFYNKACVSSLAESALYLKQNKVCANFMYDLNGNKGPNTVGKDIGFITALYPIDTVVVAPYPQVKNAADTSQSSWNEASSFCTKQSDEYRLPTLDEAVGLFINRELLGLNNLGGSQDIWTSTVYAQDRTQAWYMSIDTGDAKPAAKTVKYPAVRCIKRN